MKTPPTNEFPEIDWDETDILLEEDIDERLQVWHSVGVDSYGRKYLGSAHYVCGELEGIRDIEKI
jgi:hypothetical protein